LAEQALELARKAGGYALEKKANEVRILDLREITSITDYFVICSGDVDNQVRAIADNIVKKLREEDVDIWHTEGYETGKWVLLDLVDVVVHIFQNEAREFWGDAPSETLE